MKPVYVPKDVTMSDLYLYQKSEIYDVLSGVPKPSMHSLTFHSKIKEYNYAYFANKLSDCMSLLSINKLPEGRISVTIYCDKHKLIQEIHHKHLKSKGRTGCVKCGMEKSSGVPHGLSNKKHFKLWEHMHSRVSNQKRHSHATICEDWLPYSSLKAYESFEKHIEHLTSLGQKGTLDRVNTYLGYSPSNTRLANYFVQSQNQGMRRTNTTGYKNVDYRGSKIRAKVTINSWICKDLGFDTLEDACLAVNLYKVWFHFSQEPHNHLYQVSFGIIPIQELVLLPDDMHIQLKWLKSKKIPCSIIYDKLITLEKAINAVN